MKKTVHIAELIARVNRLNRDSTCAPQIREGWNTLLADVLHTADAYAGFRYLDPSEVPKGQEPGIITRMSKDPLFPDESRREYIVNAKLRR